MAYLRYRDQLPPLLVEELDALVASITAQTEEVTATSYVTVGDPAAVLPNAVQLLPGANITFDESIPHELTISSSGGTATSGGQSGYWTPLTDGDPDETDLIFANGDCVAVFVPSD